MLLNLSFTLDFTYFLDLLFVIVPLGIDITFYWNNIPNDFEKFNQNYDDKINKILANNLENSSRFLDEIFDGLLKEESINSINFLFKKQESLFISIKEYIEIFENKKEIKTLYKELDSSRKKAIYLTCAILFLIVLTNVINLESIQYNNFVLLFLMILSIEFIRTSFNFYNIKSNIESKIDTIIYLYNNTPHSLGDKYGNQKD